MEFVDGVLVRRNAGTQRHALLQATLAIYFGRCRHSLRIQVITEARLLVDAKSNRYRIPDVMVLEVPYQKGKVVTDTPAIVIEILSPDDTFDEIADKCFEYERLGILHILVMDPDHQRALAFDQSALRLLTGASASLSMRQTTLEFPFRAMFSELDQD